MSSTALKLKFSALAGVLAIGLGANAAANHEAGDLELYPHDAAEVCDMAKLQVRVTVNGVAHGGIMKLELYNSAEDFPKKKGRLRIIRVPAMDAPMKICIDLTEPGTYAVTGYHDIDGDRKLDKKWNMTPKEPIGVSNNVKVKKRRIPKFEEAAFEVGPEGKDIILNLVDVRKKKKQNADED